VTYLKSVNVFYRPPLWSSGQSFWLQIQRSGFDSRLYLIFWEVVGLDGRSVGVVRSRTKATELLLLLSLLVGLELSPISLVSTTEELIGRNSSGSGLGNREYGRGDPLHCPHDTLYQQKLALTSPTISCR
jgi:hypothetical protein